MRDQLLSAWRARHVLLVGHPDRMTGFMQALVNELGAESVRIPPDSDTEHLNCAMTHARISAVIVPRLDALAHGQSIPVQIAALLRLMDEAREAGIPLVILCSDAAVYRTHQHPWHMQETDATGGETADGLIHSLLQMTADGVSRGLLGDAVSTLIVRHLPCLGCGHPSVETYSQWCKDLDAGRLIDVLHPDRQGVFLHPLDICCGALALGARYLLGDRQITGAFNLSADADNILANRTAALRFIRENGGTRPLRELSHPFAPPLSLPDGTKARFLCGIRCLIPSHEALNMLLALERAGGDGSPAQAQHIFEQTESYALRLR